jgi:hypothetical protein
VSDDNVESYQLPSDQLELPVVLAQDSIASIESVDSRTDSRKYRFEYPPIFGVKRFLREVISLDI